MYDYLEMKIVSWNCLGALRKKYKYLLNAIEADIYVIQECENPLKVKDSDFQQFACNYFWIGENENKGLGIFANKSVKLQNNNWPTSCLRNFLSVKVNESFDLLGIWACNPYIEEYFLYQYFNFPRYTKNMVIIGDFNSNAIWDKKHGLRNHSAVCKQLDSIGLFSAYHLKFQCEQGKERDNTFFLYKNPSKGYHIDYCFIDKNRDWDFALQSSDEWLKYSDHKPIEIKI